MSERSRQEQENRAAQAGLLKMTEQDYGTALALFLPLAQQGNAVALFCIGKMAPLLLELPNLPIERSILTEEAEQDRRVQDRMESLPEATRAQLTWYRQAAAQGFPEAIRQLSHLYQAWSLGDPPWHACTGSLRALYDLAENGGSFAQGPALMDEIRAEMRRVGLVPKTVFHSHEVPIRSSGRLESAPELAATITLQRDERHLPIPHHSYGMHQERRDLQRVEVGMFEAIALVEPLSRTDRKKINRVLRACAGAAFLLITGWFLCMLAPVPTYHTPLGATVTTEVRLLPPSQWGTREMCYCGGNGGGNCKEYIFLERCVSTYYPSPDAP